MVIWWFCDHQIRLKQNVKRDRQYTSINQIKPKRNIYVIFPYSMVKVFSKLAIILKIEMIV